MRRLALLIILVILFFFKIGLSKESTQIDNDDVILYFVKDNQVLGVRYEGLAKEIEGLDKEAQAIRLVKLLLKGPRVEDRDEGYKSALLATTVLDKLEIRGEKISVFLTVEAEFLIYPNIDELISDLITEQFVKTLKQIEGLRDFVILVRKEGGEGEYYTLDYYLPLLKYEKKPYEEVMQQQTNLGGPSGYGQGQPAGSLTGRTVFLSQSHGWYWTGTNWTTQRGVNCNIVEDFVNAEAINQFLVQYLWNAGASVFTIRERDLGTNVVIVDNDGNNGASTYQEIGSWYDSSLTGFANGYSPYQSGTDPFSLGTNRLANVSPSVTAQAIWTPYIPNSGYYSVYVSYSGYSARVTDAHYIVRHAAGQTEIRINQRIDGHTWKFMGEYYFHAGYNPSIGQVILLNDSTNGTNVSADAVKFGGGWGEIDRGLGVSNKAKWEECCRYNTQYLGAPESVYDPSTSGDNTDDVTCRPLYAEWEKEDSETAVYISWHTNATVGGCTDSGNGTETYVCRTSDSSYCSDTEAESLILQNYIHNELINDIRTEWDATWQDRGKLSANFGELRALSTMPGVLIELAFHDDSYDSLQIKHPKFRQLAARAIYQGIVKYFGTNSVLLPEPPINFYAKNNGDGTVLLAWDAPPYGGAAGDPATGYRVYVSENGYGFNDAIETNNTYIQLNNLVLNKVYYFKVSAFNAGGESFPTETLSVRVSNNQAKLLIVNGFDRIDRDALLTKNDTIGQNLRMILRKMNAYDYIVQFAKSIDAYGLSFDSASNEAIKNNYISLLGYCAVLWVCGEESSEDNTFDATEQATVQNYLNSGGNLFISGAEIAWDLDWLNNGRSFYQSYLKAIYRDDDPYTNDEPINSVSGISGTIFEGLEGITFDNGNGEIYNVDYPDVIDINGGSVLNLQYNGSSEVYTGAGIQFNGSFKVVNLGFPFETVNSALDRDTIMSRVLDFLTSDCDLGYIPGEVPQVNGFGTPLSIQKNGNYLKLNWGTTSGSCNTVNYAIYRGDLSSPFSYNHSAFICDTGIDLTEDIEANLGSYYYIVVALTDINEGSYGKSSTGAERPVGFTSCKAAQNIDPC